MKQVLALGECLGARLGALTGPSLLNPNQKAGKLASALGREVKPAVVRDPAPPMRFDAGARMSA